MGTVMHTQANRITFLGNKCATDGICHYKTTLYDDSLTRGLCSQMIIFTSIDGSWYNLALWPTNWERAANGAFQNPDQFP